jgi:hypothetical protein
MITDQYRRIPTAYSTTGNAMRYVKRPRSTSKASNYQPILPPETEGRLHNLLDALECMDARTAKELEQLDRSGAEEDLKNFVREDIVSRYEARRLPLQNAVEELRAEYRAAISDPSTGHMTVELTRLATKRPAASLSS